jgi:DeoR/GlpR family transcriptional regulator of sugar metabolism
LLTTERRRAIADLIKRQSTVRLRDLSTAFETSDSTIRRDLEYLEGQGLLTRTYGGAVLSEGVPIAATQAALGNVQQAPRFSPEETRIGAAAGKMVAEGETVFVGAGALPLAVAHHIASKPRITVVTNSLDVATYLTQRSDLPVILTGGQVDRRAGALVGHVAGLALGELRADRAIIGVGGIHVPDGITGESLPEVQFVRAVIELMPEVIVVADAHKWGHVGPAFLAPLETIDVIVTSHQAPPAMVWDLSQLGIQIIQA